MECFSGPDVGVARGPAFRQRAEALVSLPRRVGGGGGITRGVRTAHAAWLGSWALAMRPMLDFHPHLLGEVRFTPGSSGSVDPPADGVVASIMPAYRVLEAADSAVRAARALGVVLPSGAHGPDFTLPHPEQFRERSHTQLQRAFATVLHSEDWLTLRAGATDPVDRAWLLSCGFRSIGADFMGVVPAFGALRLAPAEYAVAVRHHFAELQPVVAGVVVCGCGRPMGERGDALHYLSCKGGASGNWFSRFHDSVERQVARMMQEVYLGRGGVQTPAYPGRHVYSPSYATSPTSRWRTTMVLALHWWWRCLSSGPQLLGMWTWLVVVARVWRWRPTSGPSMETLPLACIGGPSLWTRGAT